MLFPVLVVASFLTQLSIPFRVHPSIVAIWAIVLTYAVIAAPFVLSGIVVALTLTRFPRDVGRLYAFDLVGAALGCVLLVWLLEITDGPTAVLAIAALAAIGGVFYAFDEGSTPAGALERAGQRGAGRRRRRPHRARLARLPGPADPLRQGRLRGAAALRALELVLAHPRERQSRRDAKRRTPGA